jgi:hypothetical protein
MDDEFSIERMAQTVQFELFLFNAGRYSNVGVA